MVPDTAAAVILPNDMAQGLFCARIQRRNSWIRGFGDYRPDKE